MTTIINASQVNVGDTIMRDKPRRVLNVHVEYDTVYVNYAGETGVAIYVPHTRLRLIAP